MSKHRTVCILGNNFWRCEYCERTVIFDEPTMRPSERSPGQPGLIEALHVMREHRFWHHPVFWERIMQFLHLDSWVERT